MKRRPIRMDNVVFDWHVNHREAVCQIRVTPESGGNYVLGTITCSYEHGIDFFTDEYLPTDLVRKNERILQSIYNTYETAIWEVLEHREYPYLKHICRFLTFCWIQSQQFTFYYNGVKM